ncbi:MAG: ATP-binding protein [Nitrospinae bacterium]|nr:ATP-binding protein [Nitrospinota bacterium]
MVDATKLNWGMIQDGGNFESLLHAILYAEDAGTVLFGRPGKDAGQDARSADGKVVYQAKYRQGMTMDDAKKLAVEELEKIKLYRQPQHANHVHWKNVSTWILVGNFRINPNDETKWQDEVVPNFRLDGLAAKYWSIEILEGKLAGHGHVRDVFFGGENRVLVGLKEAHDLLGAGCLGSASLEKPMVGRDTEMKQINGFASSAEKFILPIVGPGGYGKSRLLYESLWSLARDGWRVFWALPETMARSSRWFHLLNGNQRTCVAIDDPDDPGLLRAVLEQLATVERRNWKVIVAYRSEKAGWLRQFKNSSRVAEPLRLEALDEPASKQLLKALLENRDEAWLHSVYTYTHGVPGWLCLVAELANRSSLSELTATVDEVASDYVNSCLESMDPAKRDAGRTLLRWLALWGTLNVDEETTGQSCLRFLAENGILEAEARDLLRTLVDTGIVRNWGVGKRLYAAEPLIIREQILGDWLLQEDKGVYRVSAEGKSLVDRLVKGEVPAIDRILLSLSHLTRSRLDASDGFTFLKPIFDSMAAIAKDGSVLDQERVVDLVEKAGAADPESALELLAAIRKNPKDDINVDAPLWGQRTFTHADLVSKLPWILYQMAEYVFEDTVARKYLSEFRELAALEKDAPSPSVSGKGARELLERLLCESSNYEVYAQPAREIVEAELNVPVFSPFAEILLGCLLNPERESTELTARWTLSISRRPFVPDSAEWALAIDLRDKVFDVLRTSVNSAHRSRLWQALAKSHHQFHQMTRNVRGPSLQRYLTVLTDDLTKCRDILQNPPVTVAIEEAAHAREMWSWYLKYGSDGRLRGLARQCEVIYNGLSKWRLPDFFEFDTKNLEPATQHVVGLLRKALDAGAYAEFFTEAKRYLEAARHGREDLADGGRIAVLASALIDQFIPSEPSASANALTSFVRMTLGQAGGGNKLAWIFAVCVCRERLRRTKETGDVTAFGDELRELLDLTQAKTRFLYDLYSNAGPSSTGALTDAEFDCLLSHESGFSAREWFSLLGMFALVRWETVGPRLHECLKSLRDRPEDTNERMKCFVFFLYLSALRYEWSPDRIPISWIIDMIVEFGLDGALFEMYPLAGLRDRSGFALNMPQMAALVRSRMELERRSSLGSPMPYDFQANEWCRFDATNAGEVGAFHELCRLALEPGFTAGHRIPKYIAQIDPSGRYVGEFVEQYLHGNPSIDADTLARLAYLASSYPDTSEAWATIARPICRKAEKLRREEREHVYFGLSRKETGVISSQPGEVSDYYFRTRDDAVRMRDAEPGDSPLKEYRDWALRCAEADLQREQGRAEENADG